MKPPNPEDPYLEFEKPPGEHPCADLREPLAQSVGPEGWGDPWVAPLTLEGTKRVVGFDNIELTPGEEEGTLYARIHETVDRHKVIVFAGTVTVAAVLAAIAGARVHSQRKK